MNKTLWCERNLIRSAFYGLCLTEAAFQRELRRLKVKREDWPRFVSEGGHATTHYFDKAGSRVVIVCLGEHKTRKPVEVYGLLVHEAVHIWQGECEAMRETSPGGEIEAYAIQSVSQNLINAYLNATKRK